MTVLQARPQKPCRKVPLLTCGISAEHLLWSVCGRIMFDTTMEKRILNWSAQESWNNTVIRFHFVTPPKRNDAYSIPEPNFPSVCLDQSNSYRASIFRKTVYYPIPATMPLPMLCSFQPLPRRLHANCRSTVTMPQTRRNSNAAAEKSRHRSPGVAVTNAKMGY